MTRAETQRQKRTHTGFTMVEVVAAVAILGIWFTLLVTLVSDGVASETTSHIRLEASLLADEVLADAEATLLSGGAIKSQMLARHGGGSQHARRGVSQCHARFTVQKSN